MEGCDGNGECTLGNAVAAGKELGISDYVIVHSVSVLGGIAETESWQMFAPGHRASAIAPSFQELLNKISVRISNSSS